MSRRRSVERQEVDRRIEQLLSERGAITSLKVRELFQAAGLSADTASGKMLGQLRALTETEFNCRICRYRGRDFMVDAGLTGHALDGARSKVMGEIDRYWDDRCRVKMSDFF